MYWSESSAYVNEACVIRIIKIMLTEEDHLKTGQSFHLKRGRDNMD